jgi:hypothetical protein
LYFFLKSWAFSFLHVDFFISFTNKAKRTYPGVVCTTESLQLCQPETDKKSPVFGFLMTKSRRKHSKSIDISVDAIVFFLHFGNKIFQTLIKKSGFVDKKLNFGLKFPVALRICFFSVVQVLLWHFLTVLTVLTVLTCSIGIAKIICVCD